MYIYYYYYYLLNLLLFLLLLNYHCFFLEINIGLKSNL